MNTDRFLKLLEEDLGDPPVWTPREDDGEQFNRWKHWSSRKQFIENVREKIREHAAE